ncbi:phosphoribosylformylglycinamidine cyclo-ligase [Candidatus Peribacteria bacterium RIFCSPHIGHO2_02_FULL_52_16]|nr:MAG: phosphoribosylformylglycinamidine cyclo-ligase [Candidatus Peribacteria bacterium RIFCSPHIGHO2_01_FULL_51_35]OGJ60833.1 MAG: phosphoribosylformylglycinamidine cyclo-ligase [Candidatus Peribacteria bacterium RIFCSPHIGHO2_02_FULL_52_16]
MTTYKDSGVDISAAEAAKKEMAKSIDTGDKRVLNKHGAFASLVQGSFPGFKHPVLVLKTEEPGSKQKLAFENKKVRSICFDTINHLINDIVVMGATPLFVQDAVICGKLEKEVVTAIVKGFADACRAQGCVLTGGETSEQPGVLSPGTYILTASIVGVVEEEKIIDGQQIKIGDTVLAVASNGLHTNGYTLVRKIMAEHPDILKEKLGKKSFMDAILEPHQCYYQSLKVLFGKPSVHGLAHITGGGIAGNLNRILPKEMNAEINLSKLKVLPIFSLLQKFGSVPDADMLRTYNMGVGLTVVCDPSAAADIKKHFSKEKMDCYEIGSIAKGKQEVVYTESVRWQ